MTPQTPAPEAKAAERITAAIVDRLSRYPLKPWPVFFSEIITEEFAAEREQHLAKLQEALDANKRACALISAEADEKTGLQNQVDELREQHKRVVEAADAMSGALSAVAKDLYREKEDMLALNCQATVKAYYAARDGRAG